MLSPSIQPSKFSFFFRFFPWVRWLMTPFFSTHAKLRRKHKRIFWVPLKLQALRHPGAGQKYVYKTPDSAVLFVLCSDVFRNTHQSGRMCARVQGFVNTWRVNAGARHFCQITMNSMARAYLYAKSPISRAVCSMNDLKVTRLLSPSGYSDVIVRHFRVISCDA